MSTEDNIDRNNQLPLTDRVQGLAGIDSKFEGLAYMKEEPVVLEFTPEDRKIMQAAFIESGCNVELTPEMKGKLLGPKFHNLEHGRGPAVVEVLGKERAEKVAQLVEDLSIDEPKFKKKGNVPLTEGSQNWGHFQLVGDLVAITLAESDDEAKQIELRMGSRIWKGARKDVKDQPEALEDLDTLYRDAGVPEPGKTTARALPENVYPLWMAITGREIVEED